MAINLLNIEPHKVSRDLSGYITYIYGLPKTGKTTLAVQMPDCLLLAFEKGYNALPGVMAQDLTSWTDLKTVLRELKKTEVKQVYKSIVVDTVDIAAELCQKYICNQNGISSLGELGYGKGWTAFKEEFHSVFRGLTQLGYAVFFIGHSKEVVSEDGKTHIIRPALTNTTRTIVTGMSDIIGFAHQEAGQKMSVLTLRSEDDNVECGCRFKYITPEIPMSYNNLVAAVKEAIDKEAAEHDNKFVTDEKEKTVEVTSYDFNALMDEFKGYVKKLIDDDENNGARITHVVESYLGKGKKASDLIPSQAEFLYLIVEELKTL